MKNFRTLSQAVEFYRITTTLPLKGNLKDQLQRAASSVVLNLAEGRARRTRKDQLKFFTIAMGSLRESQAILMLTNLVPSQAWQQSDCVAAHLYRLIQNAV